MKNMSFLSLFRCSWYFSFVKSFSRAIEEMRCLFSCVLSTSYLGVCESGNPLLQSNNHSDCTLTKC